MTRLTVEGLAIQAGGRTLCQGLELTLAPGQCWAILGGNGSGKTILLHTLAGLLPATAGTIRLDDHPLAALPRRHIAQRLGLLLQESHDPFPTSVLETAMSGRHPHLGRWQQEGDEDHAIVHQALAAMALSGMEQRVVQTLSGGERRRLAIATLLTQTPQLLLLDEPLNHLDLHHQQQLLHQQRRLAREGRTVVMVLHDPNQALRYCDRALLLYGDGRWESGVCEELLTVERLSHLYHHPMRLLRQGDERLFIPADEGTAGQTHSPSSH
ncbi:MAG: ABC transporter ATP-binding protein [Gammaproteobacteria bacterium]|nr:ABC transporter ATP-binding protein [Gammaproteobacteria bacterium]